MVAALMLPVLVGFVGLAVDTSDWYSNHNRIERIVEASAVAAAPYLSTDTSAQVSVPTMPTSVVCTGSCSGSTVLEQYMNIATTDSVTIPFPISWVKLTSPYTVTATTTVRTG